MENLCQPIADHADACGEAGTHAYLPDLQWKTKQYKF